MKDEYYLLEEFIEWAEYHSEDVYYIFEYPKKAINRFLSQRDDANSSLL